MHKQIRVVNVPPRTCDLCPASVEFYISYRDPDNLGPPDKGTGFNFPTASKKSCRQHVAAVTQIMLEEQDLMPKPEKETNANSRQE